MLAGPTIALRLIGLLRIPLLFLLRPRVLRLDDAAAVEEATQRTLASGERVTLPVQVFATVPSRYGDEAVATFTLELSKRRS